MRDLREMPDGEFFTEWVRYFGPVEGMRMAGWLLWLGAMGGCRSYADVAAYVRKNPKDSAVSRASNYRNLTKLRGLREKLLGAEAASDDIVAKLARSTALRVA